MKADLVSLWPSNLISKKGGDCQARLNVRCQVFVPRPLCNLRSLKTMSDSSALRLLRAQSAMLYKPVIDDDDTPQVIFLKNQYPVMIVAYLVSYTITFVLCVSLLVYLRHKRSTAFKGDADAARKVILPSFEPLFWVLSSISGIYLAYFLVASFAGFKGSLVSGWYSELLFQGRTFMLFLIFVFLLQRSVSFQALVRSVGVAFALVVLSVVIVAAASAVRPLFASLPFPLSLFFVGCLLWLLARPMSRASVRTQREFCFFALVHFTGMFLSTQSHFGHISPFFVWRLLKADTEHWRGFSNRAVEFQHIFREGQGIEEIVCAQGLHVLLEMHRRDVIDFAHLQLRAKVGVGACANVYRGVLHSTKDVAVKVYSPSEISEATILEFSQEATLCSTLRHPNIVHFYGMCICPPSICLVYELCRGSLDDLLLDEYARHTYAEPLWPKLCFMLDAARAVAYLHSFSPPFIHRDIKPANLLVDHANVVKLTDFGESRNMAIKAADVDKDDERKMTVRGSVEYMAPEVIEGKQGQAVYTETADIYSLGVTLWDILHPGREKYPQTKRNHLNVFEMVLDGQRPPIDPEVHPTLHDLVENMWNADPHFRPSAKMVVATLEDLHDDLCGQITQRLAGVVGAMSLHSQKPLPCRPKTTIGSQPLNMHLLDEPGSDILDFGHFSSTTSVTLRLDN
ncbi:Aste57867_17079 [Aphanomyces stellatus]|uniref:Aste57867_17079 protein n=1 Tax=Aphanomyces stellatus TaxID=120398 RepID=A0A485L7A0_9STRA|nr:hypothetical protein As57867_017021 [Aphanomyces stellatus]VFT93839.1 Aste57867_17079 [Aphanomyces stellatus]